MKRLNRIFLSMTGFLTLIAVWQIISWLKVFPQGLLPSPVAVAAAIVELWIRGVLTGHILDSLYRFVAGYSLAVVVGIPFGLLIGRSSKLHAIFEPLLQLLRPISPIAWLPLAILWFGIGSSPTIFIIFLAAFFPITLSSVSSVKNVDPMLLRVARNFGASPRQILIKIVAPASFPYIAAGLHMAMGAAWVFLVAGEMVGVRSGLGFLIIDGRNQVRYDLVMASMVIIGTLGLMIDRLMRRAEMFIMGRYGSRQA